MIKEDQPFTEQDLFQSVDELARLNIGPYISEPLMRSIDRGKNSFDLREISPTQYCERIQKEHDAIPSSARELDRQLTAKGFDTTYKFSYDYNMSQQMRDRIVKDGWILTYFQDIFNHPHLPRNEVVHNKQFEQNILKALRVTYMYATCILQYNPGTGWYHVLNFVIGAGYGFHPLDIKFHEQVFTDNYHCNQQLYEKNRIFKKWCEQHGINAGCLILSPENTEKLRNILTRQNTQKIER